MNQMKYNNYCIPILAITILYFITQSSGHIIAMHDCDGNFFIYPKENGPAISLNGEAFSRVLNFVTESFIDRVRCACPSASDEEILSVYGDPSIGGSMEGLFRVLSGKMSTDIVGCPSFKRENYNINRHNPRVVLPETCDWESNGECLMSYSIAEDLSFDIAASRCENSHESFFSVSCDGTACDNLGSPCESDSECGGTLSCNPVKLQEENLFSNNDHGTSIMKAIFFGDLSGWTYRHSCLNNNPLDSFRKVANYIRKSYFELPEASFNDHVNFCLPKEYTISNSTTDNYPGEYLLSFINQSSLVYQCKQEKITEYLCFENWEWVADPSLCKPAYGYCKVFNDTASTSTYCSSDNTYNFCPCLEWECPEYSNSTEGDRECIRPYCRRSIIDETTGERVCTFSHKREYLIELDCLSDGPLSSWDGNRPDGSNILELKSGHSFPIPSTSARTARTEGATVIFESTCSGNMRILPGSNIGISIQFSKLIDVYNMAYDILRERMECDGRFYGYPITDTIFGAHHFLPSYFSLFTSTYQNWKSMSVSFDTWARSRFSGTGYHKLAITPDSCNFESWRDYGKCEFTYDGIASLLGLDLKFNVAVDKCDSREYPNIYVECEGEDCSMLQGKLSCDPSNPEDCPRAECFTASELLPDWDFQGNDVFAKWFQTDTDQCQNTDYITKDLSTLLSLLEDSPKQGICLPSYIRRLERIRYSWEKTQYYTVVGIVYLNSMEIWKSPAAIDETVDAETSDENTDTSGVRYIDVWNISLMILYLLW